MTQVIKIGTRESELATWQAKKVQLLLAEQGVQAELIFLKSEGDINLTVPLYEMGVQGIFTKALDIALLNKKIDLAVHSYKDVPTQLAKGLTRAAILKRDSYKDILVYKPGADLEALGFRNGKWTNDIDVSADFMVATSSIRRKAQWLHRYKRHGIENLRGNVNSRLKKLAESNWHAAIFAAAGLERIGVRPANSVDLDWMLPAPAQGTIAVAGREDDEKLLQVCAAFNDPDTDICTQAERDFLRALQGGCSMPISALAQVKDGMLHFKGSVISPDGKEKIEIQKTVAVSDAGLAGKEAALEVLAKGADQIIELIRNVGK
ncbi:MAG: hydroxymethylbilane synthase [Chitinophagaceae bacterium]|nr:hydroxymethylbilane synthase [Chitinophagaceae bacterium]